MTISFDVVARRGEARAGMLHTPHGDVPTPAFMPVGTAGAVKALGPDDLRALGATIVLANAYHLYLRPGVETIRAVGGLHRFMAWPGPILTDSGGYQAFSLGPLARADDDGVTFRSHLDGSGHRFTPELVVEIQAEMGVDVAMALDVCPPGDADADAHRLALSRTEAWARRSLEARRSGQALFAIAQGGTDFALRRGQIDALARLPFDGFALGGLGVGEAREATLAVVRACAPLLPADRPRYLMGMGAPDDIRGAVAAGVDLFDCVLPTREARHGVLYTSEGPLHLGNARFRDDPARVDPACDCPTCRLCSRAYLRHLLKANEISWHRLATLHNLAFYLRLMRELRAEIVGERG